MEDDLLADPVFTTRVEGREDRHSLPEILAKMTTCSGVEFAALRAHQTHAWHIFLVQIAGLAVARGGASPDSGEAAAWRAALEQLVADDSAFRIVVPEIGRPAFLQPPIQDGTLAKFRTPYLTPDALDVVITARNHDVKGERIGNARSEHWVYALVTLQTIEGVFGRGNYGVARMNGGFGNRPCIGAAPSECAAERFRRDLRVALSERRRLLDDNVLDYAAEGIGLVWTVPWDGERRLEIRDLDPLFIEVCRRVRLVPDGAAVYAVGRPSKKARMAADALNGVTGDPWTPVDRTEHKALTLGAQGLSYDRVARLLFDAGIERPAALVLESDAPGRLLFTAQTLVRGQGKTEGLRTRTLPLPRQARLGLVRGNDRHRHRLAELATQALAAVQTVSRSMLHPALCALLQSADVNDKLDLRDDRDRKILEEHDRWVDREFFPALWDAAKRDEADGEDALADWKRRLIEQARDIALERGIRELPIRVAARPRAIARAQGSFESACRRHFPEFYAQEPRDE